MKEPKETKCSVCYDSKYGDENGLGVITKQYCLDNPKHPTYKERYDKPLAKCTCSRYGNR